MTARSLSIVALLLAATTLAACGGDEGDETTPDETPAADADAPAMDADAPAMDADAPAMDAGTAVVTIESITGRWAEGTDLCGTDDEVTIAPEAVNMADGACIITDVEEGGGALTLGLICPVAGAEPDGGTWVVTAEGEAPFGAIAIASDGLVTNLARCP